MRVQKLQANDLATAIESFTLYAKVEGRSRRTMDLYEYVFGYFVQFVQEVEGEERPESIAEIQTSLIRLYVSTLQNRFAPTTINMHIKVLGAFFSFLLSEGHLESNPMYRVKKMKVPKQYPFVLSEEQVLALLKAIDRLTWTGRRNWAMMLLFLDGMVRLSELIYLQLDNINLEAQSIKILNGKGDKERMIFMGRRLRKAFRDWFRVRGNIPGQELAFISRGGYRLDTRNVQRIIERLAAKAGISGVRCSPHTLRHTGATLYVRNGGDPFSLQRLLGHADIQTTMIYVHMNGEAIKEAHAKASPVDRLLRG